MVVITPSSGAHGPPRVLCYGTEHTGDLWFPQGPRHLQARPGSVVSLDRAWSQYVLQEYLPDEQTEGVNEYLCRLMNPDQRVRLWSTSCMPGSMLACPFT